MDNALVIDGILAVILIAGTLIGAKRGLFKSLMGLIVVLAALIGAALLANVLTPPVTDIAYPFVESAVIERIAPDGGSSAGWSDALLGSLEEFGADTQSIREALAGTQSAVNESYHAAIAEAARAMVESIVHAALLLALYVVLLIVLKLLVHALNRVFDLPVLSALNGVGGAVLGLGEAALLLYVAVYLASRFGAALVTEHADDTYLLPIFLNHSPVELISSFTHSA